VLEAFKDTVYLVIATTGGSGTAELRSKYNCHNIIIENFIPFADVMPHCHVFITNGGYGGVILGIENTLPLVVAGIHEGKNELNARVDYFKLGIDLKTESPSPFQIKRAVDKIIADPSYRENVAKLADEFKTYDPYVLSEEYVELLTKELHPQKKVTTISCL
jgi:UDP:flavonoid glycosyltransferase YjiC (YdhE family)